MSQDLYVRGVKKKGSVRKGYVITFTFHRIKECEAFILKHHGKMTQAEIAAQLKIGTTTVTRLIKKLGLQKRFYKKRNPNPAIARKSGIFNVNRHPDWLVG